MGFNPPVLLSLLLQVLLIFLGPVRKRSSAPLARIVVWSCYLLADWVADLALGLLLNNMGNIGGGGGGSSSANFGLKSRGGATAGNDSGSSSPIIFAFWTPFLLLHLGGPDTITGYSLEDNELWLRHLIGLLFELFSAAVIIFCSIRSNPLILATILVLVAGIIKYGERTCSLYFGSAESFRTNVLGPAEPGRNYARLMAELDSKEKAGLPVAITITNGDASKAREEMEEKETTRMVLDVEKSVEARAYDFFLVFRRLFVDLSVSFHQRRLSSTFLLRREDLTPGEAFEVIELELSFMYDMMYTKAPVVHTTTGWVLRSVCSGCVASALAIFYRHNKQGISRIDVAVTYALLLGGLALDVVALAMLLFSDDASVFRQNSQRFMWLEQIIRAARRPGWRRWSATTSQLNLISYCLGKPDHYSGRCWHRVAKMLRLRVDAGILEELIFIRRVPLLGITDRKEDREILVLNFVFYGVKEAAQNLQEKEDNIRKVLSNHNKAKKLKLILDSVTESDLDESLLLWHVATDLCRLNEKEGPAEKDTQRMRPVGEALSEYMLYLLVRQPEIVSPKTGAWLMRYRDTCAEARRFFASMEGWVGEAVDGEGRSEQVGAVRRRHPGQGAQGARRRRAHVEGGEGGLGGDADVHSDQVPGHHPCAAAQPWWRAHHSRLVPHGEHGLTIDTLTISSEGDGANAKLIVRY